MSFNQKSFLSHLESCSIAELTSLQEAIAAAVVRRQERDRADAVAKLQGIAEAAGLSVTELIRLAAPGGRRARGAGSRRAGRRSKGPARYANPANPAETWSGRGRSPQWMIDWVAAGNSREAASIK